MFKINRGISTFQDTPKEVGPNHIKLLIDPILEIIPKEKIKSTPIYIYATAGMRLLPEDKREAILSEVCSYLKKNYVFLVDCNKQILNISGEEEGLYGWLGLNYLKKGFSSSTTIVHNKNNNQDILPSYGVLDMGGASTQIAYDVSQFIKGSLEDEENILSIDLHKINGQKTTYNVYSTTFLGFGMNETRRRYIEALVKKGINYVFKNFDLKNNDKKGINNDNMKKIEIKRENSNTPLSDSLIKEKSDSSSNQVNNEDNSKPIFNGKENNKDINKNDDNIEHVNKNIIKEDGLSGEFSIKIDTDTENKYYKLIIDDPCIPVNAKQNEFKPIDMVALGKDYNISNWSIDIKGTGNLDQCLTNIYPLLNKTEPCRKEPCLFNGVHSPVTDFSKMPFYGISEYWYTSHDVHNQGGVYNYNKFYNAAKELCKTNWNTLDINYKNGNYPSIYNEYLLFLSCFRSSWVMTVLHEGIGISKNPNFNKRDNMKFAEFIFDTEIFESLDKNSRLNIKKRNETDNNKDKEELVPFTSINRYKGYEVSWTLGVILNYICSTISESISNVEIDNSGNFSCIVFLFCMISIISFMIMITLILYGKYGGQRLQYTEILPIYDNYNSNKFKNRYREVISLDNITSSILDIKPSENFNIMRSYLKINNNNNSNTTTTTTTHNHNITNNYLPFRVNSDLQQYLKGKGTHNELKRVNSFTSMKKDHELI
ncbi:nucleoside phosphatase family-domain-containing protein [Neocallimastix sp. 'constans']